MKIINEIFKHFTNDISEKSSGNEDFYGKCSNKTHNIISREILRKSNWSYLSCMIRRLMV